MKKILQNNEKTKKFLDSCQTVYLIAKWTKWGVRPYKFSGKFETMNSKPVPLVYDYEDCNGACDMFVLRSIYYVTTGFIADWTFDRTFADTVVNLLNEKEGELK